MSGDKNRFDEEVLESRQDLVLIKRFWPLVKQNLMLILLSVLLMAGLAVLELAVPYVTKNAVDTYLVPVESRARENLVSDNTNRTIEISQEASASIGTPIQENERLKGALIAGAVILVIALLRLFTAFGQIVVMEYVGQKMMHTLRMQVYNHLQRLPAAFFTRNTVGRLSTRVTNDIQNMQEMFTTIITFIMKDVLTLFGIIAVMISLDLKLAAAVLSILPLVGYTTWRFSGKSREIYRLLRVKTAEINSMFSECIGGIRVIQLFTQEENTSGKFNRINHDNFVAGLRQIKLFGVFMPIVDIFGSATLAIVIYYGGGRLISEEMSLGTLIAFISYTKMFFQPLRDIAEKHNILQDALASGERITQILDKTPESPGGLSKLSRIETLSFKNISFSYTGTEPVLTDISFTLSSGESLAIVGPTGSGKTSLIHLIVGFYQPSSGKILINGKPIDRFSIASVRSRIAIVSQDPYLFSGTIRENIILPGKNMTDEALRQILDQSYVSSIINHLPDGLDTRITQGGMSLSSGERQLISIARAFAHEPDLIIFDEATSYVDTASEEKIRLAVSKLKKNRTAITIAHRLRSAMTADTILVLVDGRIAETGTHQKLMAEKGLYHTFHSIDG